jgi:iron(III) transport system substrate-binding protein
MPSPLNSGAALIHTMTLAGNLKPGWGYYEALKDNGALAAGANGDILRQVATGEKLYGMIVDFMPIREKAKGSPVEFVFPSEGVSAVSEPIAILKGTKNPAAAQAFIDFLLSKDGQEVASRLSCSRGDQADGFRRRQGSGTVERRPQTLQRHLRVILLRAAAVTAQ